MEAMDLSCTSHQSGTNVTIKSEPREKKPNAISSPILFFRWVFFSERDRYSEDTIQDRNDSLDSTSFLSLTATDEYVSRFRSLLVVATLW
jgi:hypothetical protein